MLYLPTVGGPGFYHVVNCGPSGHNIRCKASLKASAIGMMVSGNNLKVVADVSFFQLARIVLTWLHPVFVSHMEKKELTSQCAANIPIVISLFVLSSMLCCSLL